MGCSNDYMLGSIGPEVPQADLDVMTRLACDRCREIEARGGTVPDWATDWWMKHQEKDRRRIARDEKARREAEVRKQAVAKLTPEERAELGV